MDEHEFASLLNVFITSQCQLVLMLELLNNDTKRITHIPHDTRHRIRQFAYFRMIHDSDLSHPAAKGLLNKSFPYYDELSYMLGKNRATESQAETFTDVELNDPTGYEEFAADAAPDMDF
uniref:Retrotransposon protein n=1 Tax=Cucumis melo TaxID=3656 RepID=A0A9I9EJR0_CUCME